MKEKGYYYDDGKYCEIETGPSFEAVSYTHLAYHEILENNPDLEWKIFANMVSNTKTQKLSSEDLITKHDYPFMQSCISRTAIVDNAL